MIDALLQRGVLGRQVACPQTYSPHILEALPRAKARQALTHTLFDGYDYWRGYEFSWLNNQHTPQAGVLHFAVDAHTPNIIESKSFKLYLYSLSNMCFEHKVHLVTTLNQDLAQALQSEVKVQIASLASAPQTQAVPEDMCILDGYAARAERVINPRVLVVSDQGVQRQVFCSNLFRSCCPVTHQPDWATLFIEVIGAQIEPSSLHQYLLSYRHHAHFHEHCIEKIYGDLLDYAHCQKLAVAGLFTRRGGVEINPIRMTPGFSCSLPMLRHVRQ
jgi:7-cyano-7-deazaguanine reductase